MGIYNLYYCYGCKRWVQIQITTVLRCPYCGRELCERGAYCGKI